MTAEVDSKVMIWAEPALACDYNGKPWGDERAEDD